jgi:hypothetical protein
MVAGGGVLGEGDGTVRTIMIQAGVTIAGVRHFIGVYPRIGGITTGRTVGTEINGTTKQYPTSKSSRTGGTGKGIIIGRNKITGVSRVQGMTEWDHDNNMNNGATMKEEEIRKYNFLMKY